MLLRCISAFYYASLKMFIRVVPTSEVFYEITVEKERAT